MFSVSWRQPPRDEVPFLLRGPPLHSLTANGAAAGGPRADDYGWPTFSLCFRKLLAFLPLTGFSITFFNLFRDSKQHLNKTFSFCQETEEHTGEASSWVRWSTARGLQPARRCLGLHEGPLAGWEPRTSQGRGQAITITRKDHPPIPT